MTENRWPQAYKLLVDLHRRDQHEVSEIQSAIFLAEENALVRGENAKSYTAALRADHAKATGRLWSRKAELDMIHLFIEQQVPYDITLDPSI